MKNLVLKSNHKNTKGKGAECLFEILLESDSIEKSKAFLMDCAKECSFDIIIDEYGHAYDQDAEETVYFKDHLEFQYYPYWFTIVDQDEFDKGIFDGKTYGFASDSIKKYFGKDPDEVVKTYHLNWGDGEYIGTDLTELIKDIEGDPFDPGQHNDGELEVTVKIKKVMTRRQVEELPEFDL